MDTSREWRPIDEYPYYAISEDGIVVRINNSRGTKAGVPLNQQVSNRGYSTVQLVGKKSPVKVHRLVCLTFIGASPVGRGQVNHKNGIKADNRATNLEWVSCSENTKHAYDCGLRVASPSRGSRNASSKLKESDIVDIRAAFSASVGVCAIARRYAVSHTVISAIVRRRAWCHVPYENTEASNEMQ